MKAQTPALRAGARVTDREVLQQVSKIVQSQATYGEKYEALDNLWFAVVNYHPRGMGAPVLEVVAQAQTKMIYSEQKGGEAIP